MISISKTTSSRLIIADQAASIILIFILGLFPVLSAQAAEVNASDICKLYRANTPHTVKNRSTDLQSYVSQILLDCQDEQTLRDKSTHPVYNFRPVFGEENQQKLFRGGQPLGSAGNDSNYVGEQSKKQGFNLDLLQSKLGKDGVVVSLRFDRQYKPWTEVFGSGISSLPLSETEANYRYAGEKTIIEKRGMQSLYLPTVPEMESFVDNYVPYLDTGENSKPYFCRLPEALPDGASPHWVDESREYSDHATSWAKKGVIGPLVSADPECNDLVAIYGASKIHSWLARVRATVRQADEVFKQDARQINKLAQEGKKVFFHCSSGTDRVGLVAMMLEAQHDGLTTAELKAYRGPGSDPKIDLIVLHYLMSQWAGNSPEYSYLFPRNGRAGLMSLAVP